MARERVTIYRRDIGKMIEAGVAAGAGAAWRGYREAFAALCYRLPRKVTTISVEPLVDACMRSRRRLARRSRVCWKHRIWMAMTSNPARKSRIQTLIQSLKLNLQPRTAGSEGGQSLAAVGGAESVP